jgi:drug/metabolite transporter (DMT)-like permease
MMKLPKIVALSKEHVVPIILAGSFVAFSALFVLGNYQNHDGDFGQYVIQARNLLLGRPWDHLVAGLPSVPPLYSVLLASLTWLGGVNAYAYAVLNSVLWAGGALVAFHFFRREFKTQVVAYAFLVFVLFSPFVLYFQQSGIRTFFMPPVQCLP